MADGQPPKQTADLSGLEDQLAELVDLSPDDRSAALRRMQQQRPELASLLERWESELSMLDDGPPTAVEHPEKVEENERLDVARVVEDLNESGTPAFCEAGPEAIVERLADEVGEGDVIVVFSNGGFGGIHDRLLAAL